MVKIVTRIGLGFLYIITSPIIAFIFGLFFIYGLLNFVFYAFKLIFLFFSGKSLTSELKEDVDARRNLMLMSMNQQTQHREPSPIQKNPGTNS